MITVSYVISVDILLCLVNSEQSAEFASQSPVQPASEEGPSADDLTP